MLQPISKRYDEVLLKLPGVGIESSQDAVEVAVPIGNHKRFNVQPTCGLASTGYRDDRLPAQLLRTRARLRTKLWFRAGFIEYGFPNNVSSGAEATSLELSVEMCSEALEYDLDWPSDITVWINGAEVGTWTSPGDFGGERGRLTPAWWQTEGTQYGLLKHWRVAAGGSYSG